MKTKRYVLSLCCLFLALLMAVGCQPAPFPSGEEGTTADTSTLLDADGYLEVVKDGGAVEIVYPLDADSTILSEVNALADSIYKLCGVRPRSRDDWLKAGEQRDGEKIEILFGNTNYEESQAVYSEMNYGSSVCQVVGNKIVIAGAGSEALNDAAFALTVALKDHKVGEIFRIPKSFSKKAIVNEQIAAVPLVGGCAFPKIIFCGDGCYELVFTDASEAIYSAYLSALSAAGYELYVENAMEDHKFATYIDGTNILNLALMDEKKLLITSELFESAALQGLPEDNVYQSGVCSTTLTQLGLYYGDNPDANGYAIDYVNGMAYVYRLTDGSFLVIDGGHNTQGHAERLYELLKKQAPDPENITVAAWIFSHDHEDHVGFFNTFANKYSEVVKVERFLFNFPSTSQCDQLGAGDKGMGAYTKGAIKSYYPDAVSHKVHTGQVYYIRNATVRILFGLETLQPHTFDYYNDCSVIVQVEVEGMKALYLGDCGEEECFNLMATYSASTLQSDILQVAHHGINGCNSDLYNLVGASYALLPIGADKVKVNSDYINSILNRPINKYIKDLSATPGRVFMAKDDVVVFTLSEGAVTDIATYENMVAYLQ